MRSRPWISFGALLGAALLGSCGLLGGKSDPSPNLNVPYGTACLNNSGQKIQAYFDGTVDPDDWKSTFDCVLQALALLEKYGINPSLAPADVVNLAKTFLVTNQPVPLELVQAAFEVKASVLGGSKDSLTMQELSEFGQALTVIRDESTALIPLLHYRKTSPTPAHMLQLLEGLQGATGKVGAFFQGKGMIPLSRQAMDTIARDAPKVLNLTLPAGIVDQLLVGKVILFAGSGDAVEQELWPEAFKVAGQVAGMFIAYASTTAWSPSVPNDQGEFYYRLAVNARDVLETAAGKHGGGIPLTEIDQLIDTLPSNLALGSAISHSTIEAELPIVFSRFFPSGIAGTIDSTSMNAVLDTFGKYTRGQTHLKAIFSGRGLSPKGVATDQFAAAASQYEAGLEDGNDRAGVERLIDIANHYLPQFAGDDDEITFAPGVQHSLSGLERLSWMDIAADLILSSYASTSAAGGSALTFDDFSALIDDIRPIAVELGAIDPNVEQFAERRFREVNLFSLTSDADNALEKDEIMSYVMIIRSLAATTARMRADVEPACGGGQIDGMGWQYMDPECFRRVYFANADRYWNHEPELLRQYHALSGSARAEFKVDIEKAARYQGYGNQPLGGYDASGFLLFMLLQETLYLRFDQNWDGYLDTDETLAAAAPMHEFIAKQAGLNPDQEKILGILNEDEVLDAIFTYIMAKGEVPKMNLPGYAKLAIWLLERHHWNLHVGRPETYKNAYTFADFTLFPP